MNLSFDALWKIGGIVVLVSGMYYQIQSLEKDTERLHAKIEQIEKDQKWTERNLMKMEYGDIGEVSQ